MRLSLFAFLFSAGLFSPLMARADSVLALNGTLQDGTGVFKGSIVYDDRGDFNQVKGTLTDGSYTFTVGNYLGETLDEGNFYHVDVFAVNSNYDLSFYIPKAVGPNGMGGPLCSLSLPCQNPGTSGFTVVSSFTGPGGTFPQQSFQVLTATGATPEPGSFVLLASGVAGVWMRVRRSIGRRAASMSQ